MKNYDLLIVGAGIAGLTAACAAAEQGQSVQVLTYGAGTFTIGGGTIDVLGYDERGVILDTPAAGLASVPAGHPYAKIEPSAVAAALAWLKRTTAARNYPYTGDLEHMQWVPTAAGTFKPTCLTPPTMSAEALRQTANVCVLGFDQLKDFYAPLAAQNLQRIYGAKKSVKSAMITLNFSGGRDVTALDIARWLDTESGRAAFIDQAKTLVDPGSAVLVPPVLGTRSNCFVLQELAAALRVKLIETAALPPSVAGLRLGQLLSDYAKELGVNFIEKARVTAANCDSGRCFAVYTENADHRRRAYRAESFILANGGLYGGGLKAAAGTITEPIFDLPVQAPAETLDWSNPQLLSDRPQPFAKFGIEVDGKLRPINAAGRPLLNNLKIIGRNLRGYDFCFEKSGNGIAVASGYKAVLPH